MAGNLDEARASMDRLGVGGFQADYLEGLMDVIEGKMSADEWLARFLGDDGGWVIGAMVLGEYVAALEGMGTEGFWMAEVWAADWPELRERPGFLELAEASGMVKAWDQLGPPPTCRKTADGYDCTKSETP